MNNIKAQRNSKLQQKTLVSQTLGNQEASPCQRSDKEEEESTQTFRTEVIRESAWLCANVDTFEVRTVEPSLTATSR